MHNKKCHRKKLPLAVQIAECTELPWKIENFQWKLRRENCQCRKCQMANASRDCFGSCGIAMENKKNCHWKCTMEIAAAENGHWQSGLGTDIGPLLAGKREKWFSVAGQIYGRVWQVYCLPGVWKNPAGFLFHSCSCLSMVQGLHFPWTWLCGDFFARVQDSGKEY